MYASLGGERLQKNNRGLLTVVIALIGIGLVQVYSSSFIYALESLGDGFYFFKKQAVFSILAIGVLLLTSNIPFKWIQKWGWTLWVLAVFCMIATFIPGIGVKVGGSLRWISLPWGLRFEPSELLKIALSLFLATCLASSKPLHKNIWVDWGVKAVVFFTPLLLLLKQPDFGSFAICMFVAVAVLFAFGLKWRFIFGAILAIIPLFYFLVMKVPYRKSRMLAFVDPWADAQEKGFQVIQSMLTFHSGGMFGSGLGQGQGKLFYLPEAHTDFTLAVLGEETGFIGFLVIMVLYGFVIFRGFQLSFKLKEIFPKALAVGLTMTFTLNVFINTGVVLGILPTKGLTLPFISYGGSSLLMMAFCMGLLMNLERLVTRKPARSSSRRSSSYRAKL